MTPSIVKNVIRMPRKRAKQPRQRISYLSTTQLESLLKAAKECGNREWAMFLFAVCHGARASEIANLRLTDVNLKEGTVHIARVKGSLESLHQMSAVKGNAIFNEAAAFKAWLAEREPDGDNFVFNSQKSTQLHRVTVNHLFRKVAKAAELPASLWHPHVLKHTTAMLLVEAGTNAFLIRQQLGHKSFDSTLAYVRPNDQQASQAAIAAFNKLF
jgi:type 1 fimbriae regulatory protein FimB